MKSTMPHKMQEHASLVDGSQRSADECKNTKHGSRKEKYSLRERQKRRHGMANVAELPKRSNHKDDPEAVSGSKRTPNATSSKSKAPPLSKYRRKTANARERTRMREINSAFENLRHCVPQSLTDDDTGPTNEKLTKITTLRLAMKYISLLTEVLKNPNFKGELPIDFTYAPRMARPVIESQTADSAMSKSAKLSNNLTTSRKTAKPSKRLGKRKKKESKSAIMPDSSSSTTTSEPCRTALPSAVTFVTCSGDSLSSHSSSFLDSMTSPSYTSSFVPSMSELNSVTLESDGESLHLSDNCHSPMQDKFDSLFGAGDLGVKTDICSSTVEHNILGDIEAPLELSLQFLGTTPETFDFSMEQPPTTCISPLVALDAFNPFSDFLHEYPEQASLDLFLT